MQYGEPASILYTDQIVEDTSVLSNAELAEIHAAMNVNQDDWPDEIVREPAYVESWDRHRFR